MIVVFSLLCGKVGASCGDASHLEIENGNTIKSILPNVQCIRIPSNIERIKDGDQNDYAFEASASTLVTVDFQEATVLQYIGSCAFYSCNAIKSIDLTPCIQLSYIGYMAFAFCNALESFIFPNSTLSIIPSRCFYSCKSLTRINIPSNVEIIEGAFSGCSTLKEVTFCDDSKLKVLGERTFEDTSIQALTITKNVEVITGLTFRVSRSLQSISVDKDNKYFKSIGNCLYNLKSGLVYYPAKATPGIIAEIDPSTTTIKTFAFLGVNTYKFVNMPSLLSVIESSAFYDFSSLINITIPSNVGFFGTSAFQYCGSLKNATFLNQMVSLPSSSFFQCYSLTEFHIPKCIETISSNSFAFCSSLSLVYIPKSVQTFGSGIFTGCAKNLTLVFENGSDIIYVDDYLYSKDKTQLIVYLGTATTVKIISSVKTICNGAFQKRPIQQVDYEFIQNVTIIEPYAFNNCPSLVSIKLPESIIVINDYTFKDCSKLQEIEIPSKVKSIKPYAFHSCSLLNSIIFHNGVTEILEYAFYSCTRISRIILPNSISSIDKMAFAMTSSLTQINIPFALIYLGESVFSDSGIEALSFSGVLSLTNITRLSFTQLNSLKFINFVDSVERILEFSFSNCQKLETISVGPSISFIDEFAFDNCTSLKNVTILDNYRLFTLPLRAFNDCPLLNHFSVNDNTNHFFFENGILFDRNQKIINMFLRATNPKQIVIPQSIESINEYAFSSCITLEKVIINGKGIKRIEASAFEGCTSLQYFVFPSSLVFIGSYAFYNCNFRSITMVATNIIDIKANSFGKNRQLTRISLPVSLVSCSSTAFTDINPKAVIFYFGENIILSSAGLQPTCKVVCFENYQSKIFLGLPISSNYKELCSAKPFPQTKYLLLHSLLIMPMILK